MKTATVEIAYVNPPGENKKQGTIKTTDGVVYGVWPNQLGLFRPGAAYEIDYDERPWNGKTLRTVTKCRPQDKPAVVNNAANTPSAKPADEREFEFVTRVLAASISACAVEYTPSGLANAARMLRQVYRDAMNY